jgi:pimeloyl-ACP methyl ester carboxylesterase
MPLAALLLVPATLWCAPDSTTYNLLERAGFSGMHSDYHGFDCCDLVFEGRDAKIVRPNQPAAGHPWLWRARFWGHEPQTELALLARGFHLVYCDVAELFGNAEALGIWDRFYTRLVGAGLAPKAAYIGFSRGGLYVYLWALAHPERVACVYADAPSLDFKSWPGGKGKSGGNRELWELFIKEFAFGSEQEALAWRGNPLDRAAEIAAGGYPMLHVCGDADVTVPIGENTDPFEKKVLAAGGHITVIRKPGIGHHPHSLVDPAPIVQFILKATGQED